MITIGERFKTKGGVIITHHAADRAVERFNVQAEYARVWINTNLQRAQFIGYVEGDDGKIARLYGYNRIAFVLEAQENKVITIYPRKDISQTIAGKVRDIIAKELRKTERSVRALERRTAHKQADLRLDLAETERRLLRTRSEAVRLACQARINALTEELRLIDEELAKKRRERSTLVKDVVAYV